MTRQNRPVEAWSPRGPWEQEMDPLLYAVLVEQEQDRVMMARMRLGRELAPRAAFRAWARRLALLFRHRRPRRLPATAVPAPTPARFRVQTAPAGVCSRCRFAVLPDDSQLQGESGWCMCLRCYHREVGDAVPMPAALRRELAAILAALPDDPEPAASPKPFGRGRPATDG